MIFLLIFVNLFFRLRSEALRDGCAKISVNKKKSRLKSNLLLQKQRNSMTYVRNLLYAFSLLWLHYVKIFTITIKKQIKSVYFHSKKSSLLFIWILLFWKGILSQFFYKCTFTLKYCCKSRQSRRLWTNNLIKKWCS